MTSKKTLRIARWSFLLAGIYGLLVTLPIYLKSFDEDFIWGFVFAGAAAATQLLYLLIGSDPKRYHPAIPVGIASKLSFAIPALAINPPNGIGKWYYGWPWFGCVDLALAALFAVNYLSLRRL